METILIKAAQLICALSLLIVLHEGGHFMFAKLFKTRVEKFYLFFDYKFRLFSTYSNWFRRLLGKKPVGKHKVKSLTDKKDENGNRIVEEYEEYDYEGTEYGIGWIPLGGYVKISGMIDESMDKEQMALPPKPWEFRTKPAWQRLLIMLGGVMMNFIAAFAIYSMMLYAWGEKYVASEDMTYGLKFNKEAKADGFKDGDIITKIDGVDVPMWSPAILQDISNAKDVTILRKGSEKHIKLPGDKNLISMLQAEPRYADALLPLCIDSVLPETPAAEIGLKKGDKISKVNGLAINDYNDFVIQIANIQDKVNEESTHADSVRARSIRLTINDTVEVHAQLTSDFKIGFINKTPDYKITTREYTLSESFPGGLKRGWNTITSYVDQMKYVFTKEGSKSVGGFIAIGNIFPDEWDWQRFWSLTAFLSIILGVMNLLPIPALDGGHALFALVEIITRRKPSEKFLERAQIIGMYILLGLLILGNMNDILRVLGINW